MNEEISCLHCGDPVDEVIDNYPLCGPCERFEPPLPHIITVEGTIGVGKTTLAEELASLLGFRFIGEPVDANPYLERYYADPKRWAFTMQCYLMLKRFEALNKAMKSDVGVVLDRGLWGDRVFAWVNAKRGYMTGAELDLYHELFDLHGKQRQLDGAFEGRELVIYLYAPLGVTLRRMGIRGRDAEQEADIEYLSCLRERYEIEAINRSWKSVNWEHFRDAASVWAELNQ